MKKLVSLLVAVVFSLSTKATVITFDANDISPYGGNQADVGGFNIFDGGNGLEVYGNYWVDLDLSAYPSLDGSVLSLEFMTTNVGQVHGIAFDDNDTLGPGGSGFGFQFGGSQSWGIPDYIQNLAANTWYSFEIDLSGYDMSGYDRMVFIADSDRTKDTDSLFRNVSFEVPQTSQNGVVSAPSTIGIFALIACVGFLRRRFS